MYAYTVPKHAINGVFKSSLNSWLILAIRIPALCSSIILEASTAPSTYFPYLCSPSPPSRHKPYSWTSPRFPALGPPIIRKVTSTCLPAPKHGTPGLFLPFQYHAKGCFYTGRPYMGRVCMLFRIPWAQSAFSLSTLRPGWNRGPERVFVVNSLSQFFGLLETLRTMEGTIYWFNKFDICGKRMRPEFRVQKRTRRPPPPPKKKKRERRGDSKTWSEIWEVPKMIDILIHGRHRVCIRMVVLGTYGSGDAVANLLSIIIHKRLFWIGYICPKLLYLTHNVYWQPDVVWRTFDFFNSEVAVIISGPG